MSGKWRNIGIDHIKLKFPQKCPFTLNHDTIPKKCPLVKRFKIKIPPRQDWQMPDKIDPDANLWSTDGLGIHNCCGVGIFESLYNYRESILMGSLSTVFSAKVMAILRCTELLLTKNLVRRRIHICSDSRAVLAALAKTTTKSSLIWVCMQMLGKLSEYNNVTLVWIPGHQGSRQTGQGRATEVPPNQFIALSFSVSKKLIKKQLELRHQDRCTACNDCQQSGLMQYPLPSRASKLPAMSKLRLRAAVGMLTGHTSLTAHLYKPGHTEQQECRLCVRDKRGQCTHCV
jgi:hypothetical protein